MMLPPPSEVPLWALFATVAVLTGFSSWLSHWLAMWMTFSPIKFQGLGPIGWQGIIPKRAGEISSAISKDLVQKFGNVGQIFEYLGPEKTVNHITNALRPQLDTLVDEVMTEKHMVLWENLPISIKNRMYARMHRMLPRVIDDIVEDIGDQILWIVQIENLIAKQFENQPERLVALFKSCSQPTRPVIAWFSALSCSILSWIPLGIWYYFDIWWVLPLGLAILMILNSWLALNWLWKNHYRKHKQAILTTFIDLLGDEILTSENIFQEVFKGPKGKHANILIKKHVNKIVDHSAIRSFVQLTTGLEGFVDIKQTLGNHITNALLEPLNNERFNQERAKSLKTLFQKVSKDIGDDRFETLLWPIVEAEKIPLLLMSSGFGATVGIALIFFL